MTAPVELPVWQGPGWSRHVATVVVGYRDPSAREVRRLRSRAPIALRGRVSVTVAPTGERWHSWRLDQLWASRPRGRGARVLSRLEVTPTGDRVLLVAWDSPLRCGGVRLVPLLG